MNEAIKNTIKTPLVWAVCMIILGAVQWLGDFFIGNEIIDHPPLYCEILWCLFASFSGSFEAYYYDLNSKVKNTNPNLHALLTIQRAIVIIPILVLTNWKCLLCYIAMFPLFHDGSYYLERERIAPGTYPKKWFDVSTTSTAKIDILLLKLFSPKTIVIIRTTLAFISMVLLVLICYKII